MSNFVNIYIVFTQKNKRQCQWFYTTFLCSFFLSNVNKDGLSETNNEFFQTNEFMAPIDLAGKQWKQD